MEKKRKMFSTVFRHHIKFTSIWKISNIFATLRKFMLIQNTLLILSLYSLVGINEVTDSNSVVPSLGTTLSAQQSHHHDPQSNSSPLIGGLSSQHQFTPGYYAIISGKYQENGDALSDFVNLVCQEAQHPPSGASGDSEPDVDHPQSPTAKYYNPMASMLPPPPPPPMARPVALQSISHSSLIRTSQNDEEDDADYCFSGNLFSSYK